MVYFRFFIILIKQDLVALAAFQVCGLGAGLSELDTRCPVFNEPPKYNKYEIVVVWLRQQTRNLFRSRAVVQFRSMFFCFNFYFPSRKKPNPGEKDGLHNIIIA